MAVKKLLKPRNPFMVQLLNRQGGGAHGKSVKAKRTKEKVALKRGLLE